MIFAMPSLGSKRRARIWELRDQISFPSSAWVRICEERALATRTISVVPTEAAAEPSAKCLLNLFTFEIDIWGRLRRATESAQAQLLASEWNRKEVSRTLISDVATAYFNLLELDMELAISRNTLGTRRAFAAASQDAVGRRSGNVAGRAAR